MQRLQQTALERSSLHKKGSCAGEIPGNTKASRSKIMHDRLAMTQNARPHAHKSPFANVFIFYARR